MPTTIQKQVSSASISRTTRHVAPPARTDAMKNRQRERRDEWKKKQTPPSRNDLVNAYLRGVKKGLDDVRSELLKSLSESVVKLAGDREKIADYLRQNNFTPLRAFLCINEWNKFKMLFLVPEKDFLSDSFLNVYDVTYGIEEVHKKSNVHLDIGFINGSLSAQDEKRLESDGFYLDWDFNGNGARKA